MLGFMEEGKQENLEKSPPIKRERGTPNKLYMIAQSTSQISVFFYNIFKSFLLQEKKSEEQESEGVPSATPESAKTTRHRDRKSTEVSM